jgi:hypothetical protein
VWTAGTRTPGVWSANTWTPNNHNTWNGCVMDRGYPASPSYLTVSGSNKSGADTINNFDAAGSGHAQVVVALCGRGPCPQAVMGLNYDWTTMNQLVTNMSPAGNINQAIGLELGWLSLVGGGPFTAPPMGSNYTYSQMIILPTTEPLDLDPELDRYAAATHRPQQILPADVGRSDRGDVPIDRHQAEQSLRRQISGAADHKKSPANRAGLCLSRLTQTTRQNSIVDADATYLAFAMRLSNGL